VTGAGLPENPGYDMGKDFAPIGLIASVPIVIMSNPSVPVKSISEVIALAKKDGDKVTVGTPPAPTLNYFGVPLAFFALDILCVFFRRAGQWITPGIKQGFLHVV
jgi:hypothetical protein